MVHQEKVIFAVDYRLELYLNISGLVLDSPGRLSHTPLVAQELRVHFG